MKEILDLYSKLLQTKNRNLTENTYIGLAELFIKNGHLDYASFILCKMDRLGIKIPRKLLDLFLDYSINNNLFKEEVEFKLPFENTTPEAFNKFDEYDDPDYAFYFKNRNNYKKRKDMKNVFSQLSVDAQPFFPKKNEIEQLKEIVNAGAESCRCNRSDSSDRRNIGGRDNAGATQPQRRRTETKR